VRRPRQRHVSRARLPLGLDGARTLFRLWATTPRRAVGGARTRLEVPRGLASRDRDPVPRRARRLGADRPRDPGSEEGARKGAYPRHVCPRSQYAFSGVRARRRRDERRDGDRHRRERARLLRLARLPPRFPSGFCAGREARDEGRGGGPKSRDPRPAPPLLEGAHRSSCPRPETRYEPDDVLLRPWPEGLALWVVRRLFAPGEGVRRSWGSLYLTGV